MKQLIIIKYSGSYANCKLLSVYQVENELYVLIETLGPGVNAVDWDYQLQQEVTTDSDAPLDIKLFVVPEKSLRSVIRHDMIGLTTLDPKTYTALSHPFEFKKQVRVGKCLYVETEEKIDLSSLLVADPVRQVLIDAKLNNEVAYQLLLQNPHCVEILKAMHAADYLDDDEVANNNKFADLVSGMKKFQEVGKKKMIELFRLLSGGDGKPFLLTPIICETILENVFQRGEGVNCTMLELHRYIKFLQIPNQKVADTVFDGLNYFPNLHYVIQKFDQTNQCELYLFEHAESARQAISFANYMIDVSDNSDCKTPFAWMTVELFKYIVDHFQYYRDLIEGYMALHSLDMLTTHRKAFEDNLTLANIFLCLKELGGFTKENVNAAFANKSACHILSFFEKIGFLPLSHDAKNESDDILKMFCAVLHDDHLTSKVLHMSDLYSSMMEDLRKCHAGYADREAVRVNVRNITSEQLLKTSNKVSKPNPSKLFSLPVTHKNDSNAQEKRNNHNNRN